MFRCNVALGTKVTIDVDDNGGDDTEKQTKTKHNGITNTLAQSGLSAKV
jgi:hypothetical protein